MSRENVELVRSLYAAWERRDWSLADWADPQIEFVFADGPSPGRWTGLAGMVEGWRGFLNAWEDFRGEAEEFRELDDERVLVLLKARLPVRTVPSGALVSERGKTSGLELGQTQAKGADLFHLRDGKVTRIDHYFDRERAFVDLGLAPEAGLSE
jgi:ketosteroid isomerase-like protein